MELARQRSGRGAPLLLLHGTGSSGQVWAPVLEPLAGEYDVIAPDLPGFGASPPLPHRTLATPRRLAEAVGGLLDELGLDRAHLAGNSLGGEVALELAKLGRARSVCALSPSGFWTRRERGYVVASIRSSARLGRALLALPDPLWNTRGGRTLLGGQMLARPWRCPPAAYRGALQALVEAPGLDAALDGYSARFGGAERVDVPTTIAWAEHDRLLPRRQAARAREALPQAEHVVLRGCGHVPTWDDPEQVAAVILAAARAGELA